MRRTLRAASLRSAQLTSRGVDVDDARASREWVTFDDPEEEGRLADRRHVPACRRGSASSATAARACSTRRRRSWCSAAARTARTSPTEGPRPRRADRARARPTTSGSSRRSAASKGIYAKVGKNDDGYRDWRTRLVKDACIFLNRVGFRRRAGLRAAPARDAHGPSTTATVKPEVCWQLPLRRVDDEQEDGTVISTLTEFGRDGWGEGGDDFAWWCTEAPEAFTGDGAGLPLARRRSCARCSARSCTGQVVGVPRGADRGIRLRRRSPIPRRYR